MGSVLELVKKPFHFFYKKQGKEGYLNRTAIDAFSQAKKGECLIAYANFATSSYMYHGGSSNPTSNIELAFDAYGVLIHVKASKSIHPGEELLLPIEEHLGYLPKNFDEELNMNMNPSNFPIYKNYEPHLCLEVLKVPLKDQQREKALTFLEEARNREAADIFIVQCNVTLTAGNITRYTPIKVGNGKRLSVGIDHWADDNILDLWSQLLIDIDTRLIALDSSRKKTLIFGAVVNIFERVRNKEWEKIKRLYRKDRLNYLDYNRFFIPINESNQHWTLLCVHFDTKTMIYIDSFHKEKPPPERDPKILLGFLEYFASFDKREFDRKDWKFSSVKGVKQVFIVTYCNMI